MTRRMLFVVLISLAGFRADVMAADGLVAGVLDSYATMHSIGVEWHLGGDDDHDAQAILRYRKVGSSDWKEAQAPYRVDFQGYDMFAGSILFLQEDSRYELDLTLTDPDGGGERRTWTQSTRPIPRFPVGPVYHVVPGNGGGEGSESSPFQGIVAAQQQARPGETFLLHAGDYGAQGQVYFTRSGTPGRPIVWKAAGDGVALFNQVRIEADHVWLHGLRFEYTAANGTYGLRTSPPGPEGVMLTRNTFINCHICIYLNDGGADWYIADNVIIGDNDPQSGSDFSGEGIELWYTSGHTIAHNRISRVADGISYPRSNVDIFGNDIFDTTDDGIEGDYGHNNVRIWRNRISNPYNNGISFQPMNGAPWYVLYNQVAAPGEDALKLRSRSDRVLLAHNTLIAWNGPVSAGSGLLKNMHSRNNLWISVQDRYVWEHAGDPGMNWKTDLDYDGFDWGDYVYAFKWGDRLKDLAAFRSLTGHEQNAVRLDADTCLQQFDIPGPPPMSIPFQHFSLRADCIAVDAGQPLANVNDGYWGQAPDLGAYERGRQLPRFGPRPLDGVLFADSFEP